MRANEVREKLHGKSMSIARHRSRRLVQLLESIGILETVSSSENETDSIREIDSDDSKTETQQRTRRRRNRRRMKRKKVAESRKVSIQ